MEPVRNPKLPMLRMQPERAATRRPAFAALHEVAPAMVHPATPLSGLQQKRILFFKLQEQCRGQIHFLQAKGALPRPVEHRLTGLMNDVMATYAVMVEAVEFDPVALTELTTLLLSILGAQAHAEEAPNFAIRADDRLALVWVCLERFLLDRARTSPAARKLYVHFQSLAMHAFSEEKRRESVRFLLNRGIMRVVAPQAIRPQSGLTAVTLPTPRHFQVRDDLDELSPLSMFRRLPIPYDEILRLDCASRQQAPSVHRQLRFFAALEDVAKPFSVATQDGPTIVVLPRNSAGKKMRDVIRQELVNPGKVFVLRMQDGAAAQLHGDEQSLEPGQMGRSLAYLSEDFTRSLSFIWGAVKKDKGHPLLHKLFAEISGWCFDASLNKLSNFVEENFAVDTEAVAPNLDDKATPKEQMYEYLRVFRVRCKRDFYANTGLLSEDERGELHAQFRQNYFHDDSFRRYLRDQAAFVGLSTRQVGKMVMQLIVEDLLPRTPFRPSWPPAPAVL